MSRDVPVNARASVMALEPGSEVIGRIQRSFSPLVLFITVVSLFPDSIDVAEISVRSATPLTD